LSGARGPDKPFGSIGGARGGEDRPIGATRGRYAAATVEATSDDGPDRRKLLHDVRGEATAIGWAARSLLSEHPPPGHVERLEEIANAAARIERFVDEHAG
jgi:hypothetical protein